MFASKSEGLGSRLQSNEEADTIKVLFPPSVSYSISNNQFPEAILAILSANPSPSVSIVAHQSYGKASSTSLTPSLSSSSSNSSQSISKSKSGGVSISSKESE